MRTAFSSSGGGGGDPPKTPKQEPSKDAPDATTDSASIAATMRQLIRQILQAMVNMLPDAGAANPAPAPGPIPGGAAPEAPAPGVADEEVLEADAHLGTRWYAVTVGLEVGVFNDWHHVANITQGIPGTRQRRYRSWAAADRAYRRARHVNEVHVVNANGEPVDGNNGGNNVN